MAVPGQGSGRSPYFTGNCVDAELISVSLGMRSPQPAHVNYLVQAFRYRGKTSYRDAIYLSYDRNGTERLRKFVSGLGIVSGNFSLMAADYLARRAV